MTINKNIDGEKLIVALEGRLDTLTAPALSDELDSDLGNIKQLLFDFSELEYISSAGIRVLLAAYKRLKKAEGTLTVINANDMVREVFELTGLYKVITTE